MKAKKYIKLRHIWPKMHWCSFFFVHVLLCCAFFLFYTTLLRDLSSSQRVLHFYTLLNRIYMITYSKMRKSLHYNCLLHKNINIRFLLMMHSLKKKKEITCLIFNGVFFFIIKSLYLSTKDYVMIFLWYYFARYLLYSTMPQCLARGCNKTFYFLVLTNSTHKIFLFILFSCSCILFYCCLYSMNSFKKTQNSVK